VTTDDYVTDAAYAISEPTRTTGAGSSVFPYDFDTDGRCVRDDRHRYVYDVMGRLREVTDDAGATLMTQDYDAVGRVSVRAVGGSTEALRYLGPRVVQAETGAAPAVMQRCLSLHPDEIVLESGGGDRWAHQDGRLSLLALSDMAGGVLERYSYAPFGSGEIWAPDGVTPRALSSANMRPIFGGHRLTGLDGVYDARARAYDAETGRFLQRDPRGYASGPNPYVYLRHDPVDLTDPAGEILPIIAAIVIFGAVAGVIYSAWDASDHPERYQGPFAFRAFFNTGAGAVIGGISALGGEAVLASVGMGSFGAGAAGGAALAGTGTTLTLTQTFVLSGTVSTVGGLIWRTGFNGLFPEYEAPPSVGTMASDYALGGALGLGFRALEAVGNPFSRAGWNTIRTTLAEARVQARVWWNQAAGRGARAEQLGRDIAEIRVRRLNAAELQDANYKPESLAFRVPGEGQRVVFRPEIDVVTDSAWIQVKASAVPGRAARFDLAQAEYTALGSPTGRSIFYVEPGAGYRNVVRDLLRAGVSEVRPLTPALRGIEPFPLPFQGLLGLPVARVPWTSLLPDEVPSGGGVGPIK
jgi:RHS repeat-associated protein